MRLSKKEDTNIKTTTLKLGKYFQLNTPSFWTTLVCVLCTFVFFQTIATLFIFSKMTEKMLQHEEALIELILKKKEQ